MIASRAERRTKRHRRLRKKVLGTAERPRLQIQRTLHHIYAIVVDDALGHTLFAASTRESGLGKELASHTNVEAARRVGETIGAKVKAAGIASVVFDTSGLKYHGRVAALADGARAAGLEF